MLSILTALLGTVSLLSYTLAHCVSFSEDFERALTTAFEELADEIGTSRQA